jgi:hypothetical protein
MNEGDKLIHSFKGRLNQVESNAEYRVLEEFCSKDVPSLIAIQYDKEIGF